MRKAIGALLLTLIMALPAGAGISGTAQWEVRSTGSNNNGGFFNGAGSSPGTDFSQQDAAQYTFADLASVNASTTCVVTSASHNFVAADNRNALHITAGTSWTVGWYEIISVSANAATLDRACGSVASVSSGTFFVGGGQADLTNIPAQCVGGNTINIKTGTYTLAAALSFGQGINNSCNQIFFIGYGTTHGDETAPPTITTATNSTNLFQSVSNVMIYFDNLIMTNTAATRAGAINSCNATCSGGGISYLSVKRSKFDGFSTAIACAQQAGCSSVRLESVEIKNSTGAGYANNQGGTRTHITDSWIHGNAGDGIQFTSGSPYLFLAQSLLTNNTGKGINAADNNGALELDIVSSTIANNTLDGVITQGAYMSVSNSIFYGNGGWGINLNGTNLASDNIGINNAFGSNGSGNVGNGGATNKFTAGEGPITLTASPFVSATNFALNATAGGGAAVASAGYPGAFPGGSTTGTIAVGAVQAAGGGAASTHAQGFGGGYSPP